MAKKGKFSLGVFGIVLDKQKRVLLAKRRDLPIWNLPGGGVLSGENPIQALKREVKEETGAEANIKNLIGIYFKKGKDEVILCYLVKIKPFSFKPTDEAVEIKYFSFNQLPENFPPSHRERIEDALNFKGKLFQRIQQAGRTKKALQS